LKVTTQSYKSSTRFQREVSISACLRNLR